MRAGAQEDLDKISMSSSRGAVGKKKAAPRTLKPLPTGKTSVAQLPKAPQMPTETVIASGSLVHRQSNRTVAASSGEGGGNVIDMGLGGGKSINHHKKQRKEALKDIDQDVN